MKQWQVLRSVFPEVITDNFCRPKANKKAPIPLGIRAFPNLAFSSCGAYGTRTRDPMRDRHVF